MLHTLRRFLCEMPPMAGNCVRIADNVTIGNARRVALRIFSGKNIFISRLSHSAECSKRYFHRRVCSRERQLPLAFTTPTPVKRQFSQARRFELQIKIIIPLIMAKAQQKPFKIVPLPGDSSKQAAKPYDTRGLLNSSSLLPLFNI